MAHDFWRNLLNGGWPLVRMFRHSIIRPLARTNCPALQVTSRLIMHLLHGLTTGHIISIRRRESVTPGRMESRRRLFSGIRRQRRMESGKSWNAGTNPKKDERASADQHHLAKFSSVPMLCFHHPRTEGHRSGSARDFGCEISRWNRLMADF